MNVYRNPHKERIMRLATAADSYGFCRKNYLKNRIYGKQIFDKHFRNINASDN
jgi:hypothetical protein